MPTWITVSASIISAVVLVMGVANFPYVPLFFGLYGGERYTVRGKLVYALIWFYPIVTIVCLYLAWKGHGYASIVPIGYVIAAWNLRVNKDAGLGRNKSRFKSKDENLKESLSMVELHYDDVAAMHGDKKYLLLEFFAETREHAQDLRDNITENEKIYSPVEMQESDGSFDVKSRILLESTDKQAINGMVKHLVDLAWKNHCELSRLSILEELTR